MEINIRLGVKTDLPQVLSLIKELAEYERAPKEVTVSLTDLEKDGFGKNPIYTFYVAEDKKRILGMVLFYIKYSTWKGKCIFIDDIIVSEKYRKAGIGKKLFDKVVLECKKINAKRLEWQVLEWNEPAINFYNKLEAVLDPEWINGKLTEKQIADYKYEEY